MKANKKQQKELRRQGKNKHTRLMDSKEKILRARMRKLEKVK